MNPTFDKIMWPSFEIDLPFPEQRKRWVEQMGEEKLAELDEKMRRQALKEFDEWLLQSMAKGYT